MAVYMTVLSKKRFYYASCVHEQCRIVQNLASREDIHRLVSPYRATGFAKIFKIQQNRQYPRHVFIISTCNLAFNTNFMHEIWVFSGRVRLNSRQESFRHDLFSMATPSTATGFWLGDALPLRCAVASERQLWKRDENAECVVLTRKCTNPSRDTVYHSSDLYVVQELYFAVIIGAEKYHNYANGVFFRFSVNFPLHQSHSTRDSKSAGQLHRNR